MVSDRLRRLLYQWTTGEPPIGVWQTNRPVFRIGQGYFAWRLLPNGDYEYRPLTQEEYDEFIAVEAW